MLLLISGITKSQTLNKEWIDKKGNTILLGQITPNRLSKKPFKSWYKENYNGHSASVNNETLTEALESIDSITIFMGTWCGDSKREVPQMMNILETYKFDSDKIKIVCVDRSFNNYKQSPGGEHMGQNIHRVPTFIFHQESEEIGRIVESPVSSLEEDIVSISKKENYQNSYAGVTIIHNTLEEKGIDYISANLKEFTDSIKPLVSTQYDLNTYGYQLLTSWEIEEAVLVFELNTLLFPDEDYPNVTLGKVHKLIGNNELAIASIDKALVINPENDAARKLLSELQH